MGKPTLKVNFAKNLLKKRVRAGLSQEALAVKAGISVSYVSMLERAARTPPLDTIEALAGALKVPPLDMLRE